MRYLLDSTLFIDLAVGRPGVAELVESLFSEPNDLYTCDVVVAEALTGGSDEERAGIGALLQALEYVSTSPDAAVWATESRRRRKATSGRSLGDAIVAAVAWSLEATVVTRNPKDFEAQGVPVLAYG